MSLLLLANGNNGGAAAPTYATWNQADKSANLALSNGDLTITPASSGMVRSTIPLTSGKHRWKMTGCGGTYTQVGFSVAGEDLSAVIGASSPAAWGFSSHAYKYNNGGFTGPVGSGFDTPSVIDCYLNLDDNLFNMFIDASHDWVNIDIAARGATAVIPAFYSFNANASASVNFGATSLGAAKVGTDGAGVLFSDYRSGVYTP